jgi:hypothetical protein
VLPRSQCRRTLEAVDEIVIVLTGSSTIAQWYSAVPVVSQGSLEASVERMEAQVDGMPHDDGLRTQGHHHTHPFLGEFTPSAMVVHTIKKVQNVMRNMQDYTKIGNSGNQIISLHDVHYDNIASIRSSIKEK